MRENNWKTNGFLDGYRRQASLYSFCTSTLLATIAESQTSCHFVFISEVEEEDLITPTTVVFWNKAGLVGGQTHRCGLARLGGALSSLSKHQLRLYVAG